MSSGWDTKGFTGCLSNIVGIILLVVLVVGGGWLCYDTYHKIAETNAIVKEIQKSLHKQ